MQERRMQKSQAQTNLLTTNQTPALIAKMHGSNVAAMQRP